MSAVAGGLPEHLPGTYPIKSVIISQNFQLMMQSSRKKTNSTSATFDLSQFEYNLPMRYARSPCAPSVAASKRSRMSIGNMIAGPAPMTPIPPDSNCILIDNERLKKQNHSLQAELLQKDQLIKQLRLELDEAVMVNTKARLDFRREVEQAVERELQEKDAGNNDALIIQIQELERDNRVLREEMCKLNQQLAQQRQSRIMQINRLENEMAGKSQQFLTIRDELLSVIGAKENIIDSLQKIFKETKVHQKSNQTFESQQSRENQPSIPCSQIRRNR